MLPLGMGMGIEAAADPSELSIALRTGLEREKSSQIRTELKG